MLLPVLNERTRRLCAAAEAKVMGRGGIAWVAECTGVSVSTIRRGMRDLESAPLPPSRVRRPGGGRKRAVVKDRGLVRALDRLIEPTTRGDPGSPLRWTIKSVRRLAQELTNSGHPVSRRLVAALLHEARYSLQGNRKSKEGNSHPDRDSQFRHISESVQDRQAKGQPVISVDTKKKELVGDFKNAGVEWRPRARPEIVRVHDFEIEELGKVVPYGVYDLTRNAGWVSVGVDHDTASFAVSSIRRWWRKMGQDAYPDAKSLLVTADCGGSNGNRTRLWRWELQKLANETGLAITVSHFPPGTSKWNKIEHRLFSFISQNWRGKPLLTHAAIVNLIAATRTSTGLIVRCHLDRRKYPAGVVVSDQDMARIDLCPDEFHGEWNYTIRPAKRRSVSVVS